MSFVPVDYKVSWPAVTVTFLRVAAEDQLFPCKNYGHLEREIK